VDRGRGGAQQLIAAGGRVGIKAADASAGSQNRKGRVGEGALVWDRCRQEAKLEARPGSDRGQFLGRSLSGGAVERFRRVSNNGQILRNVGSIGISR
jgi:hypothetical protein